MRFMGCDGALLWCSLLSLPFIHAPVRFPPSTNWLPTVRTCRFNFLHKSLWDLVSQELSCNLSIQEPDNGISSRHSQHRELCAASAGEDTQHLSLAGKLAPRSSHFGGLFGPPCAGICLWCSSFPFLFLKPSCEVSLRHCLLGVQESKN